MYSSVNHGGARAFGQNGFCRSKASSDGVLNDPHLIHPSECAVQQNIKVQSPERQRQHITVVGVNLSSSTAMACSNDRTLTCDADC